MASFGGMVIHDVFVRPERNFPIMAAHYVPGIAHPVAATASSLSKQRAPFQEAPGPIPEKSLS